MPVACRSCSLRHLLPTFRHSVTVRFRRRATGERRVRSLLVVEFHPPTDHPLRLEPSSRSCRYTAAYFRERHSSSMNTLSKHRPRLSIEQRIPAVSNNPVNAILVNWLRGNCAVGKCNAGNEIAEGGFLFNPVPAESHNRRTAVATIPEQFLFCWDSVAQLGDLERLQLVLDALPDEPLMQLLEAIGRRAPRLPSRSDRYVFPLYRTQ